MNKLLPIAGLLLISGTALADSVCAKYVAAPLVTIDVATPQVRYVPTSISELQNLDPESKGNNNITLGMTYSSGGGLSISTGYAVQEVPDGYCVSPQVTAQYNNQTVTVLIPKELPVDSCLYQETLNHENKHVEQLTSGQANLLKQAASAMSIKIRNDYAFFPRLSDAKPWLAGYQADAKTRFETAISRAKSNSEAIDNPQEYKRVSDACPSPKKKPFKWFWED